MKKFIIKSFFFISPFIFSYAFYYSIYNPDVGDLSRISYLNLDYNFKANYPEHKFDSINFEYLPNLNRSKYKILNIGDSFSRQELGNSNGYLNYLKNSKETLNMPFSNPVERLHKVLKSNILDSLEIQFVILQSVERDLINRLIDDYFVDSTNIKSLTFFDYKKYKSSLKKKNKLNPLFAKSTLDFTLNLLSKPKKMQKVIKFETTEKLFSHNNNDLFIYDEDISSLKLHDLTLIKKANNKLNKIAAELKMKNIYLIVLIAPDKYEYYYRYIKNSEYQKPILFDLLNPLHKDYLYINTLSLLKNNHNKDLYYLDDTHWSPIASKIVAEKIDDIIHK